MERASKSGGWLSVEHSMNRQIENGLTTEEHYLRHFEQAGLLDSWNAYRKFREDHPELVVPDEINRIPVPVTARTPVRASWHPESTSTWRQTLDRAGLDHVSGEEWWQK